MTSMPWRNYCAKKFKLLIDRRKHKLIKHQQHDFAEKFTTSVVFECVCTRHVSTPRKFNFIKLKISKLEHGN